MNAYVSLILNGAIGDQYGLPLEMMPREVILARFPTGVSEYVMTDKVEDRPLTYSDDTQMTLSLLHHIVAHPDPSAWDPRSMMLSWLQHFEPSRGYSRKTYTMFCEALDSRIDSLPQADCRTTNGGLMRVAPLAKYLFQNPAISDAEVLVMVQLAHYPTHVDPETCFISLTFLRILEDLSRVGHTNLRRFLAAWLKKMSREFARLRAVLVVVVNDGLGEEDMLDAVIGLDGILAHEALGAALCCMLFHSVDGKPYDIVKRAIEYGGDCDTIASIAGQMAGAAFGKDALDPAWLAKLENRDQIEALALRAWHA
jgi:ADP-ribosyl-[dinitrogen reductase] hydrolase